MKKIKTLTLLTLMLGSIVTTQAQEKQNDATLEETIAFLNKYSYAISCVELEDAYKDYGCRNVTSIEFGRNFIEIDADEGDYDDEEYGFSFDINRYNEVIYKGHSWYYQKILIPVADLSGIYGTKLTLVKPYSYSIKLKHIRGFKGNKGTEFENKYIDVKKFWFYLKDDDELEPRIEKALEHLVYLASEQRKKERQESGEKF